MLHQIFGQTIYEYQDHEFITHASSWFNGTADLNWTNELRLLRNIGDLDQIDQFCQNVPDYAFVNFITNHASTYFQKRAILIGIWPFAMTSDLCHATHNHPDSILSGTYYVDTPAGSGAIQFHNQSQTHAIIPRPGMLLIWPSAMVHSVPKCDFMGTRRAISFDIALAKR